MILDSKMTVSELMRVYPSAMDVFIKRKMLCVGCPTESFHTLEDVAYINGIALDQLLEELRESIKNKIITTERRKPCFVFSARKRPETPVAPSKACAASRRRPRISKTCSFTCARGFRFTVSLVCATPSQAAKYIVLSCNDLGMHCYNRDFRDLAVLPPFNNLWAQVVEIGDPPRIVTEGITVTYRFPNNTYSVGKSNFWDYDQQLFGVNLPANIGLTGKGLSGLMDKAGDHFIAEGIPLTEFQDSAPATPYPYQLASIVVRDISTNSILTSQTTVAPVSTEMRCVNCHHDGGVEGIVTGRVETNILTLHDEENSDEYPAGHTGLLMQRRPVLCAECHASNALNAPGVAGIPNLSRATHKKHAGEVAQTLDGCYLCHPGPQTK